MGKALPCGRSDHLPLPPGEGWRGGWGGSRAEMPVWTSLLSTLRPGGDGRIENICPGLSCGSPAMNLPANATPAGSSLLIRKMTPHAAEVISSLRRSYWACALSPRKCCNCWSRRASERPRLCNKRSHCSEPRRTATREARPTETRETPAQPNKCIIISC